MNLQNIKNNDKIILKKSNLYTEINKYNNKLKRDSYSPTFKKNVNKNPFELFELKKSKDFLEKDIIENLNTVKDYNNKLMNIVKFAKVDEKLLNNPFKKSLKSLQSNYSRNSCISDIMNNSGNVNLNLSNYENKPYVLTTELSDYNDEILKLRNSNKNLFIEYDKCNKENLTIKSGRDTLNSNISKNKNLNSSNFSTSKFYFKEEKIDDEKENLESIKEQLAKSLSEFVENQNEIKSSRKSKFFLIYLVNQQNIFNNEKRNSIFLSNSISPRKKKIKLTDHSKGKNSFTVYDKISNEKIEG